MAYRPPGMLQPQRIELPGYLNTPARRPDGEPLSPEERSTSIRKIKDLETGCFQANFNSISFLHFLNVFGKMDPMMISYDSIVELHFPH